MAGFNYYPMYQNTQQLPQHNGINWVQGAAGAKAWMVAPGQTVLLMDSEGQTFYIKSADQSGMPSLRVFDFQERVAQPQQQPDALSDLVRRVEALEARMVTEVKSDE